MAHHHKAELPHIEDVYRRQQQRAVLLPGWLETLQLQPGEHVLDLGSGPGYMSLQLAQQVGPQGLIYAIDSSEEAIRYLQTLIARDNILNIRCQVADILQLQPFDAPISGALLTMVLHHADDPERIIHKLRELLPQGGRALIAEYSPGTPAQVGPPPAHRIAPEQIKQWCQKAGLSVVQFRQQSEEHYLLLVM